PGFGEGARCLYNMSMNFLILLNVPPRFLSGCKCRAFFRSAKPFRKKNVFSFSPAAGPRTAPCNELPETSRMLRLRAANLPPFSDNASFFERFFLSPQNKKCKHLKKRIQDNLFFEKKQKIEAYNVRGLRFKV